MKKNSFGENLIIFFVVIVVIYIIGAIGEASEPKCIKAGCDNKQASGSSYCYLHKPYSSKSSSYGSSSYSSKTSDSSSKSTSGSSTSSYSNKVKSSTTKNSSYNSGTQKSSTETNSSKKSSTYHSYDDGYDDIYMDGDYDYGKYENDSDYADGVDDAMDEFGEEW